MKALLSLTLFFVTPAFAQAPPAPVAITLTAEEVRSLESYLGGQAYIVVAPVMGFLSKKQTEAREAAAKAAKPEEQK